MTMAHHAGRQTRRWPRPSRRTAVIRRHRGGRAPGDVSGVDDDDQDAGDGAARPRLTEGVRSTAEWERFVGPANFSRAASAGDHHESATMVSAALTIGADDS